MRKSELRLNNCVPTEKNNCGGLSKMHNVEDVGSTRHVDRVRNCTSYFCVSLLLYYLILNQTVIKILREVTTELYPLSFRNQKLSASQGQGAISLQAHPPFMQTFSPTTVLTNQLPLTAMTWTPEVEEKLDGQRLHGEERSRVRGKSYDRYVGIAEFFTCIKTQYWQ